MIQRIQSVYLFIVFLLMVIMFFLPIPENVDVNIWPFFCGLIGAAALGNIFAYKKRKRQMAVCRFIGALLLGVVLIANLPVPWKLSASWKLEFSVSSLFFLIPLAAAGFAFAAYFAIKKDEKLVRSLDRLR